MAPITFNATYQKELVREQIETFLVTFRETLDAFVSNRMRRAVAEAEHAHSRKPLAKSSQSVTQ